MKLGDFIFNELKNKKRNLDWLVKKYNDISLLNEQVTKQELKKKINNKNMLGFDFLKIAYILNLKLDKIGEQIINEDLNVKMDFDNFIDNLSNNSLSAILLLEIIYIFDLDYKVLFDLIEKKENSYQKKYINYNLNDDLKYLMNNSVCFDISSSKYLIEKDRENEIYIVLSYNQYLDFANIEYFNLKEKTTTKYPKIENLTKLLKTKKYTMMNFLDFPILTKLDFLIQHLDTEKAYETKYDFSNKNLLPNFFYNKTYVDKILEYFKINENNSELIIKKIKDNILNFKTQELYADLLYIDLWLYCASLNKNTDLINKINILKYNIIDNMISIKGQKEVESQISIYHYYDAFPIIIKA